MPAYGLTYPLAVNLTTPFLFAGKHGYLNDPDSGMLLLGHRYYLPKLGRFLTQDPKGHDAGLNLYEYAGNNPLTHVDPDGLDDLKPGERARVEEAIGLIQSSGFVETRGNGRITGDQIARDLREMLSRRQIQVERGSGPVGEHAFSPLYPWTTGGNATINIWEAFVYPSNSTKVYTRFYQSTDLAVTLIHEYWHTKKQSNLFMLTHPSEREDRAYGFQARFLRHLVSRESDPQKRKVLIERAKLLK